MNNTEYMMRRLTIPQTSNNEKKSYCFLFHKWNKLKKYQNENI
jgi:hypothetical protein